MPHADAALFSAGISKSDAYGQVEQQLTGLFEDQRAWVPNLANASSLLWALFHALPAPLSAVNWAGFYVRSDLYPKPVLGAQSSSSPTTTPAAAAATTLLLGPFAGLPACQSIPLPPPGSKRAPGVCAAAFLEGKTKVVPDVEARPGHIACDAKTKSEIVVPIVSGGQMVGVLDVDCEMVNGFDKEDEVALRKIAELIGRSCDW